jgi:hypothetical protein
VLTKEVVIDMISLISFLKRCKSACSRSILASLAEEGVKGDGERLTNSEVVGVVVAALR